MGMAEHPGFFTMVQLARQGGRGHRNELALLAQPRINGFFLRLTLNPELAEDLTQDTLLSMLVHITRLEKTEKFWPWLYRIAWNRLQQHYRNQKIRAAIPLSELNGCPLAIRQSQLPALQKLIHQEALDKLHLAIGTLKETHRQLIDMRCRRHMTYAQIAQRQQCNPLQARLRFFRAKQSLRQIFR